MPFSEANSRPQLSGDSPELALVSPLQTPSPGVYPCPVTRSPPCRSSRPRYSAGVSHRATCPALPTARPRPAPRAEWLGGGGGRAARVSARPRRRRDPSSGARAGQAQLAGAPPRGQGCGRYKRAAVAARPARSPERDGQPPRRGKMLDGSLLARWLAAAFGLTLLLAALRPSAAYFG